MINTIHSMSSIGSRKLSLSRFFREMIAYIVAYIVQSYHYCHVNNGLTVCPTRRGLCVFVGNDLTHLSNSYTLFVSFSLEWMDLKRIIVSLSIHQTLLRQSFQNLNDGDKGVFVWWMLRCAIADKDFCSLQRSLEVWITPLKRGWNI